MGRLGRHLKKVMVIDHPTLRECVIASFEANGPMSDDELCQTLPHYNKVRVREMAGTVPDEVTGR